MTLQLRVEDRDPTPPFEQIRRQVAALIEVGALVDGTRLPPVRQLAADLGLAAGTVARSYSELERAGLVRSRRGAGTTVVGAVGASTERDRRERTAALAVQFVQQARTVGLGDGAIRQAVDAALAGDGGAGV